jgi:hypothetical protein
VYLRRNETLTWRDNSQLAEQYGPDVASEALARSRSNLNLHVDALPTVPYAGGGAPPLPSAK